MVIAAVGQFNRRGEAAHLHRLALCTITLFEMFGKIVPQGIEIDPKYLPGIGENTERDQVVGVVADQRRYLLLTEPLGNILVEEDAVKVGDAPHRPARHRLINLT